MPATVSVDAAQYPREIDNISSSFPFLNRFLDARFERRYNLLHFSLRYFGDPISRRFSLFLPLVDASIKVFQ